MTFRPPPGRSSRIFFKESAQELRVRRQSETAMKIAQFLEKHPKVTKVQTLNLIGTLKLEEGIEIGTRRRRHEELNV